MDLTTADALLVAVVGGLGAFAGSTVSALTSARGRRRERRQEQQRADAEVMGPAMVLLSDANPEMLGMFASNHAALRADLYARLGRSVGFLQILAAGHPSQTVRSRARELSARLIESINLTVWHVEAAARGDLKKRDKAVAKHDEARQLAEKLLDDIARYGKG